VIKLWSRTALAPALMTTGCKASATEPLTLADYMALSGPPPSAHIAYGPAPSQYVELFEPEGQGPFPVVVLLHGGCWSKELEGIVQMRDMAGALAARGVAVWSVEYRRADEPGGGYPGTYQDINAALAALRANAGRRRLDTRRIVAMGHSAGGHLAQWIAGRPRLPAASPLKVADPLPIGEIISLGGLNDLRRQADQIRTACDIDVARLTGPASPGRPDPFADTSPAELTPNGSHTVLINGELDTVSPPALAAAYAERARKTGDRIETVVLPGASHFDEVATRSPAWNIILPLILKALREPEAK
jgi:acetyl esterase/lipase